VTACDTIDTGLIEAAEGRRWSNCVSKESFAILTRRIY